jgi:hypothetical protein
VPDQWITSGLTEPFTIAGAAEFGSRLGSILGRLELYSDSQCTSHAVLEQFLDLSHTPSSIVHGIQTQD